MTAQPNSFPDACIKLTRSISGQPTIADAFSLLSAAAVAHIPAAGAAGITVLAAHHLKTTAATSDLPEQVDALQYKLGGPCVDASLGQADQVHAKDLLAETRWPEFTAAVLADTPVRSMLSSRLYLDAEDPLGALNLYAHAPRAFDANAAHTAWLLVTHATPVLALVREREKNANLQRALKSNRTIGIAIGVLMTRHKITREEAFDLLCVASQHSQRKLFDVAAEVAHTGILPRTPRRQRRTPGSG